MYDDKFIEIHYCSHSTTIYALISVFFFILRLSFLGNGHNMQCMCCKYFKALDQNWQGAFFVFIIYFLKNVNINDGIGNSFYSLFF